MFKRTAVPALALLICISFSALADVPTASDPQAPPASQLCPLPGAADQAPEDLDLDGLGAEVAYKARICLEWEAEQWCGSSECDCFIIATRVYCSC